MSGIKRFCADTHFGHKNIAVHRGFENEFDHDEKIVDNWNSVVNKKDVTYILGDITMEKRTNYEILKRLNGKKIVILGNHDMKNHVRTLLEYVDHVAGCINMHVNDKKIMLTHIPIHPMEFDYRLDVNIHGHIHSKVVETKVFGIPIKDKRYKCVSMEHIQYTPKTLEELLII